MTKTFDPIDGLNVQSFVFLKKTIFKMHVLFDLKIVCYTSILLTIYLQETETQQKGTWYKSKRSHSRLYLRSRNVFKIKIEKNSIIICFKTIIYIFIH